MYTRRVLGLLIGGFIALFLSIVFAVLLRRPDCPSEAAIRTLFFSEQETLAAIRTRILAEEQLRVVGYDRLAGYASRRDLPFLTFIRQGSYWITAYESEGSFRGTLAEALMTLGSDEENYGRYIALLRKLGSVELIRENVDPSRTDSIKVVVCRSGIVPSGATLSFLYLPEGITPQGIEVSSIDTAIRKGRFYVPLEKGWYLYRENW